MEISGIFMALAAFTACWAAYYWYEYSKHQQRVSMRAADLGADLETRVLRRKSLLLQLGDRIDRTKWAREKMQPRLEMADLQINPSEYLAAVIFLGVFTFLAVRIMFETPHMINLISALAVVTLVPRAYLNSRRDHYLVSFDAQMPEVAVLMSNSLRAGLSVSQAFEVVAEKMERPAGEVFNRISHEIRLGVDMDRAMFRMLERLPSEELRLMVTTIMIQHRAGGNLAHALSVMSEAMTARFKLKDEVQTMTAEARFTGWILIGLPIVTLVIVNRIMPGAVATFLSDPYGIFIAIVFIAIMVVSFVLIRRVSTIRV
ncbi:MAG: type II secretion system F family protein [Anaerolineae bacterium]